MKLLITGANGQLGRELQRILSAGASQIGPIPSALAGAEVVAYGHAELDAADAESVAAVVDGAGFDVIFNCAGMTNVDGCESDVDAAYAGNALAAELLAQAAQRNGAKLVHVSTDYVFAGDDPTPRREGDPTAPATAYGRSKLEGERLVAANCARHFIVRTSWLYGFEGGNFVRTMLRLAREKGVIRVVDDQHGCPTNANDLAHHLLKLAATEDYGIYHCSGKGVCSWYDFACAIVEQAGIECSCQPCTTDEFPRPARRPAWSALENARLASGIGDEMRPWQEALRAYLASIGELSS